MTTQKLIFVLLIASFILMTACKTEEVTPTNTPPSKGMTTVEITASDFSASIDENAANGDAIGTFSATVNFGSIKSYEITSQSVNGAVALDANTGEITVVDAAAFNFEVNTSITGKIKITADNDTETEVNFTITINDLQAEINIKRGTIDIVNGDTVDLGGRTTELTVILTIENLGQDELNLTETPLPVIANGIAVISAQPDATVIPVGGSTTCRVRFTPPGAASTQDYTGSVEIKNNDADEGNYMINFKVRFVVLK